MGSQRGQHVESGAQGSDSDRVPAGILQSYVGKGYAEEQTKTISMCQVVLSMNLRDQVHCGCKTGGVKMIINKMQL